jgi:hypothetical protein
MPAPASATTSPSREELLLEALRQSFCNDGKDCVSWLEAVEELSIAGDKALFNTNVDQDAPNMIVLASSACRKDAKLFSVTVRGRNGETLAVRICEEAR